VKSHSVAKPDPRRALVVMMLAAWACGGRHHPPPDPVAAPAAVLEASAPVVQVRSGDATGNWTLSRDQDPDIFTVVVPRGQRREVCFESGPRSLCRTVAQGGQADFVIRHQGVDYPTRIAGVPPMAEFDDRYQAAHRGRIEVEVPEVYELVNVAIAITPTARASRYLVARSDRYHGEVEAWFARFADHPLIAALDRELVDHHYFDIKMNGYAFEFDGHDRIVRSPVYDRTGFPNLPTNSLAPHLEQLQAFADASRFRDFYRDHRAVYQAQESFFRDTVDLTAMLDWLRGQFPSVPGYDGYKVVFSPLVGGSQSVTTLDSNGYRELQVHVNYPYPGEQAAGLSAAAAGFARGEIVFTELNHGFINPAAEPYREAIGRAFADRGPWATPGSSADSYQGAMSLFLEMMNWALVAVLADDVAPAADRAELIARLDQFMGEQGRGFPRFAPFRAELERLYRARAPGHTVESLYPAMIAWCEAQGGAAAAAR